MKKEMKKAGSKTKGRTGRPAQAAVAERAYFRWLARNGEHGKDLEDWLDAEQEMMENIFDHDVEG